jgi:hypothetical protein
MTIQITVVTDAQGNIVAAHHEQTPQPDTSVIVNLTDFRAGLLAGPGQTIRVLAAPDSLVNVTSPVELETQLKTLIPKP